MEPPTTESPLAGKVSDQTVIEQSLLRVPLERIRLSLRAAQRDVDSTQRKVLPTVTKISNLIILAANNPLMSVQIAKEIDLLLTQLRDLKSRLEVLDQDCQIRYKELAARQTHLSALYKFNSMADPEFEPWTKTRLERFMADYLLQTGRVETAKLLINSRGLELLCDSDVWEEIVGIEKDIRGQKLRLALNWCERYRHALKKIPSTLEFYLRLQLFLEMLRLGTPASRRKAIIFSQKYLSQEANASEILPLLSGIMIFWTPESEKRLLNSLDNGKYASFINEDRFHFLADLFVQTARQLFSILVEPPLLSSLSVGLSVLKTPMCRKSTDPNGPVRLATAASLESAASTVCPICSPELVVLADELPYGHHTSSLVDSDLVVLPNGSVYSQQSLDRANSVFGDGDWSTIHDPCDPKQKFQRNQLTKVYIS